MRRFYSSIVFFLIIIQCAVPVAAQEDTTDIFELSLEDLLKLELESGGEKKQSVAEIPAGIVIISAKDIKENGWCTLEEILRHVPGMYMINDYLWFGSDNFGVRGFFTAGAFGNMVVMVNGLTQKEDWYNSFPLTKVNVPVELIDRIEIIRGPMSVVYGNNALLGSINIITNEQQKTSRAGFGGGNAGSYRAYGKTTGFTKDLKYAVNAGVCGISGIDAPYSDMMSRPADPDAGLPAWGLAPNATTGGQLSDHRMYLGTSFSYNGFYFKNAQTFTKRGVIDFYPGYADGHLSEIESVNNLLGYRQEFENQSRFEIKIGHYNFRNRLDYKHENDTTAYAFNDIYSDAADMEIRYGRKFESDLKATLGLYYRLIYRDKLVVDAPNLSDDYINLDAGLGRQQTKNNRAAYLHLSYPISPRLNLIGGLRLEQSPQYEISYKLRFDPASGSTNYLSRKGVYLYDDVLVIPRFAIIFALTPEHHLKFMYGRALKEPSIGENMDVVRFPARPQLQPAFMQTFELNYLGLINDHLSLNASLFHNLANNLISRTNTIQNGEMQLFNTNSGELQTIGTEMTLMIQPSHAWFSKLSFAYQHTKNLQKGYEDIEPEYAPPILIYLTSAYTFWKENTVAVSAYYVDEMQTYWVPDRVTGPDDPRSPEQLIRDGARLGNASPAYFMTNMNVRFNNMFQKGFFVGLYLHNVLDTEVRFPVTRSNDIFDKGTLGYGRMFSISAGIEF